MKYKRNITGSGNSHVISIPTNIRKNLKLEKKDKVIIHQRGKKIIIEKINGGE